MITGDNDSAKHGLPLEERPFMFWESFLLLNKQENRPLIENLIQLILMEILAQERGISVSESEVQDAADSFRRYLDLESAEDTFAYLERAGLEIKDFEFLLEAEVLYTKLKQAISHVDAVQEIFTRNMAMFETVELAGLSFESLEKAEGYYRKLMEGKAIFPGVSETGQVNESGGKKLTHFGLVTRADLTEEAAVRVFADDAAEFEGPIEKEGRYWVYHILLPKRAELNEVVYSICEDILLKNLLHEKQKELLGRISL